MPENKKKEDKIILVSGELIVILNKLRVNIKEHSWDVLDKNISWKELTAILARKLRKEGFIKV